MTQEKTPNKTQDIITGINRIKEDLQHQMEATANIGDLLKTQIDRDYHLDPWDLSERELDAEMGEKLTHINNDIHLHPESIPLPEGGARAKAKGFLKKFISRTVRLYTDRIFERQIRFNEQVTAFHLATFIRLRQNRDHINALRDQLKTLEEDGEMLKDQLSTLKNQVENTPEKG